MRNNSVLKSWQSYPAPLSVSNGLKTGREILCAMVESPVIIRGKYCLDPLGDESVHERGTHSDV